MQVTVTCFRVFTYCYRESACDGTVDQVGLDLIPGGLPIVTRLYRASDLVWPRPSRTFTSPTSGLHTHDIQGNELELVVGGTVDEGDVVLAFIG